MMEKLLPTIEKQEQIKKRVFVEVGTNEIPLIFLGRKQLAENDIYIGLDINKSDVKEAKKVSDMMIEGGDRPEIKNRIFTAADMRRLPLPNKSVDELFLGNVLGDPSIPKKDLDSLLEEIRRVLTAAGHAVIKETNTPLRKDELSDFLLRHNFKISKMVRPLDSAWAGEMEAYHQSEIEKPDPDSYAVYVKPL